VTNLSHEARLVIDDGKGAYQPTNADRLRMTERLTKQLGAASVGVASTAHAGSGFAPSHFLGILPKIIGVVGLLAVGGGGLYLSNASVRNVGEPISSPSAAQYSAIPVPLLARAQETVQVPNTVDGAGSTQGQGVRAELPSRPNRSRSDTLGQEVAILTLAGKELHNGRPAAALKALDEHQRRFPSGALAQERSAARIQTLCALGRTSQAAAESAKLSHTSLGSPQISLAARACAPSDKK
jgi:hypothetical protein